MMNAYIIKGLDTTKVGGYLYLLGLFDFGWKSVNTASNHSMKCFLL